MAASRVRGDYQSLAQISQAFDREAENTRRTLQSLQKQMGVLESGDWISKGATAFYQEMNSAVLPAMKKLASALDTASQTTKKISQIVKRAEDDSAALFKAVLVGGAVGAAAGGQSSGAGAGGSGAAGSTGGTGGSGGAGGTGGTGGAGGTPAWQQNNPLLTRDPNSLFSDGYMKSLIGSQFQGADSSALRNAMNELARNPTGASDELLGRIAQLRGRPFEEIKAGYQKFLQAREQAIASGKEPPEQLWSSIHGDFMGSTSQMRYGKIVGDAFGMDPVFGAMLNPTGGMVGPDNKAFDADSSAVGYHGIVHDAAGYLYNYHNHAGPGYDYLGREGRNTASPYSGQREGIRYWRDTIGGVQPGSTASEYFMRGVVVPIADAGNWISDKFNRIRNIF